MLIEKDLDFTGKTILVTGSGRNIGRAISSSLPLEAPMSSSTAAPTRQKRAA